MQHIVVKPRNMTKIGLIKKKNLNPLLISTFSPQCGEGNHNGMVDRLSVTHIFPLPIEI